MPTNTIQDRASGAIMGALIGDALALGPHWYYDLAELRNDYGDWIDDYTNPKPGRYHDGIKAGQPSQAGFILTLMLKSLAACGGYDEKDFCERMDSELFPLLDGMPVSGPGNYTSQSIREAWRRRVQQNLTGALTGAQTGLSGIPKRFVDGLDNAAELGRLASAVAALV
ncbi:ADP-ribosylglycohydrolase [Desulfosarcina variabilis str. Montpellier]|uniref:ADP-ribosylglycohydrolase family protein n=1 Tax=Desulfosarcina variabilis TaxID=2300 RepID=UPI003AFB40C1